MEVHPEIAWFEQCVTFNFFPSPSHELAYNLFNVTVMYIAPLIVIIVSYSLILCEITRKSREGKQKCKRKYTDFILPIDCPHYNNQCLYILLLFIIIWRLPQIRLIWRKTQISIPFALMISQYLLHLTELVGCTFLIHLENGDTLEVIRRKCSSIFRISIICENYLIFY